jgi:hypothetical protein
MIAAVAVGLAMFWFWPRERGGEAAQPQPSSHGQADRTPPALAEQPGVEPQRSGVPDAGTGLRVEVAPPAPGARRVVSESGRAIEGARAIVLREDGCPRPGAPLGVSDAEGWLRMAAGSSARWEGVVVLGRGHVPTRAADHEGGPIVMKVAPGLTGRAVDRTGQPLAGVKVVVSRAPVSRACHDVVLDSDHGVVFERAPDGVDVQGRDGGSRWQHGAVFAATSAADGNFLVGVIRKSCGFLGEAWSFILRPRRSALGGTPPSGSPCRAAPPSSSLFPWTLQIADPGLPARFAVLGRAGEQVADWTGGGLRFEAGSARRRQLCAANPPTRIPDAPKINARVLTSPPEAERLRAGDSDERLRRMHLSWVRWLATESGSENAGMGACLVIGSDGG